MMKALEMELETGHFSLGVIQNAMSNAGAMRAWYKEFGDIIKSDGYEKFREIIWVLSEKAIIKADILTPDYVEISGYRLENVFNIDRRHSIQEIDDLVKVTLQQVKITFDAGNAITLVRPKNRSSAEHFDLFCNLIG